MDAYRALREHLRPYLAGRSGLARFKAWFVPFLWDLDEAASAEAAGLARKVELRLSEHSNGHLSTSELRTMLLSLMRSHPVSARGNAAPPVHSDSPSSGGRRSRAGVGSRPPASHRRRVRRRKREGARSR